jgi:hypothetical protein
MKQKTQMNTCKNCNEPVHLNYCPNCGQPAKLKRVGGQYIIQEIGDFFFVNKRMLYTIKRVLISPGETVRQFLTEDRYRFVKPIAFLLFTSLVYTLVNYLFGIGAEDYDQQISKLEGTTASLIINWMLIDYPGYAGIITGLFIALWVKIFFRKSAYNLFEIFILLCFITGITTLFISVAAIIQGITHHLKILQISSYISTIYFVWAIGQFFDKKKAISYIKVFLSFVLSTITLSLLIQIIGLLIDLIIIKQ